MKRCILSSTPCAFFGDGECVNDEFCKDQREYGFDLIQSKVYTEYVHNGYLDMWMNPTDEQKQIFADIAELGLIGTEITETMEKIRSGEIDYGDELADIIIRTLNFSSRKGINVLDEILKKHNINMSREKLHGRVV